MKSKKVLVIGGGPAGCEAARIAATRGHSVTLLERNDRLGGQINLAIIPPYKQNVDPLIEYYRNQLELLKVDVKLNTEATPEFIKGFNADAVIFATGTRSNNPPIKGSNLPVVKCFKDTLKGGKTGKRVVIIGGGTIGCELAEYLSLKGKKVAIVEMMDTLAAKMAKTAQTVLLGHLEQMKVQVYLKAKVTEIKDASVTFEYESQSLELPANTVIMCIGDKPENSLYTALKDTLPEAYLVGDASGVGDIKSSVRSGYLAGKQV